MLKTTADEPRNVPLDSHSRTGAHWTSKGLYIFIGTGAHILVQGLISPVSPGHTFLTGLQIIACFGPGTPIAFTRMFEPPHNVLSNVRTNSELCV